MMRFTCLLFLQQAHHYHADACFQRAALPIHLQAICAPALTAAWEFTWRCTTCACSRCDWLGKDGCTESPLLQCIVFNA